MPPDEGFIQADHVLVATLAHGDAGAAAELLDDDFIWVDSHGRIRNKNQLALQLPEAPLGDERLLSPAMHNYGDIAAITVDRDKIFVWRIWVKRKGAWRALVVHEVSQNLPAAPHGPGRKAWENPCRELPYMPRNSDERDCLAAWQRLKVAVMQHEPEVWAKPQSKTQLSKPFRM